MSGSVQGIWEEQADEPEIRIDGRVDPHVHDTYWQTVYWGESYYRSECSYDDYAPAYCVGYVGYAQYGGRFEDAEKSLCANWLRIKGDSRLTLDEAMQAIRAAWQHAEQGDRVEEEEEAFEPMPAHAARPRRQPAYAAA